MNREFSKFSVALSIVSAVMILVGLYFATVGKVDIFQNLAGAATIGIWLALAYQAATWIRHRTQNRQPTSAY